MSAATMQMQSKLCKRDSDGAADYGGSGGLSLPEDIILEVLLRLPAKALRRFRCVFKGWRALILDSAFVAARRSRGCAETLIVAVFGSAPELELRLLDDDANVLRVLDVRAPALLAPTRHDLIFVDRMQLGAAIIDPASGRASPVVGTNNPYWAGSKLNLLNDYSFGRASPSGDYKVLHIVLAPPLPRRYNVYSEWCEVATIIDGGGAEEPTWRQRPWGPFRTSISSEHKATVNGVHYFMPHDTRSASHGRNNHIAAFDLESEEWKPETIKGPRLGLKKEADKWSIALAELKGTLCVVHNIRHLTSLGGHYANVWLLMDPSRGIWVKEYTIQMPERLLSSIKPLDVLGDGTTLLLLNTFLKAGNVESYHRYILQFYDSSTETFTDFSEMAEGFNGKMAFYTGSLPS